jgi:hypothetical protein
MPNENDSFERRPDGTPAFNVMLQLAANMESQRTWWRQDDNTWTDGHTISSWSDIERQGKDFTPIRPISDARLLLHAALVEGDGLARALLADELEGFYRKLDWDNPRHHAIVELTRNPTLPPDQLQLGVLVQALHLTAEEVLSAVEPPSRNPPRHSICGKSTTRSTARTGPRATRPSSTLSTSCASASIATPTVARP